MNVLSYVIFGEDDPKVEETYWSTIPFLLIANSLLFPDFKMKVHVAKDATQSPEYEKLLEMPVEVSVSSQPYQGTQPTTWRMKPLWDKRVHYCFCRDVDALPISEEIKAMRLFTQTGHLVHGMRGYHLHTTPLMAGLCGFNCTALRNEKFFPSSFTDYENLGRSNIQCPNWVWGCDQEILRRFFFGKGREYMARHTVDSPLGSAPVTLGGYNPLRYPPERYEEVRLPEAALGILKICDEKTRFAGEPNHASAEVMAEALKVDCPMTTKVREVYGL